MQLVKTRAELRERLRLIRAAGKSIGLVPTMGALHAGHLSLVDAARRNCDYIVATIFVNPTQFAPTEDLAKYPRTLEADLAKLKDCGTDLVFAPSNEEMYPPHHDTVVEVGAVARPLEGAHRPGHFRGVVTIVLKLFNLVMPTRAYFGRKDFQQALVIRRMVADLDVPIEIHVCPTVREVDGLALSSRNVYLSPAERERALAISRSLRIAGEMVKQGERESATILGRMQAELAAAGIEEIDYVMLADPETLAEVSTVTKPTVAAIAARVGTTRLIDNTILASDEPF